MQGFESRRLCHDPLETLERRSRTLPADEQENATDLRQVMEQQAQPNLANKPGRTDEQNIFAGQSFANRQGLSVRPALAEAYHGLSLFAELAVRRQNGCFH